MRRHKPQQDPAADLVRNLEQFRFAGDVTVFLSRRQKGVSREVEEQRRDVPCEWCKCNDRRENPKMARCIVPLLGWSLD
jgi:hypothetical protein